MSNSTNNNPPQHDVIPIIAEELIVEKRQVETGKVRIGISVHEQNVHVEEPGFREIVEVVRVPIGQMVEGPVTVRQEGDTTIIPVFEERPVVVKRLFLKEEVHLIKRRVETRFHEDVNVRFEEAQVQRTELPQTVEE